MSDLESKAGQRGIVKLHLGVEREGVPGDVTTLDGCREVLDGLGAGTVEPQLGVAVEIEPDEERVSCEHQSFRASSSTQLLHDLRNGGEIGIEVLVDYVGCSVSEPHIQVAGRDQVHRGDIVVSRGGVACRSSGEHTVAACYD